MPAPNSKLARITITIHPAIPTPTNKQKCTNLSFGRLKASKQRGRRRRRVREKKIAPVHRPHHSSATGSVGLLRVGEPRGHRPLTRLGSRHTYSHPIQPNPNQPHHSFIVATETETQREREKERERARARERELELG